MTSNKRIAPWIVALVVIVLIVAGAWYLRQHRQSAPAPVPSSSTATRPAAASTAPEHPIAQAASSPASASTAPLPALADSDGAVASALARLLGADDVASHLAASDYIPRFVAMVDALPRRGLGRNVLPLKPPPGHFTTAGTDDDLTLSEDDFARYDTYMQWVRDVDVSAWVAWYVHAYPLFQQAYRNLGYPHGYFNDRLVTVINHLLQAPEPRGPVAVVKTDKGYAFADPALEKRSAGQKMMLRVGPTNEKIIKRKLRAIRDAVTGAAGPVAGASTGR